MNVKMKRCLLLSILYVFVFSGCSLNEKEQCKGVVSEFLTAYQAQDATCGKYLYGNNEDELVEFEGFQSVLAEHIRFEIKSAESSRKYCLVDVVITNVDFGAVFDELLNNANMQINTTEDIKAELEKRLQAENAPMRDFEIEIKLNKDLKIEMTSELSNALLGGYTQYIYELTEGGTQ